MPIFTIFIDSTQLLLLILPLVYLSLSMSDPFAKLVEAQKTFLNPTLDLIQKNLPLHEHCYYNLSRYPPNPVNGGEFWTMLEDTIDDISQLTELIQYVTNNNATVIPLKEQVLSNLNLVQKLGDKSYLQYLFSKQPRRRITVNLVRKNPMINPDLAKSIELSQSELNELTSVRLKIHLHRYIKTHRLQDDHLVTLDQNIVNLLGLSSEKLNKQVHYFELLKLYNSKYLVSH